MLLVLRVSKFEFKPSTLMFNVQKNHLCRNKLIRKILEKRTLKMNVSMIIFNIAIVNNYRLAVRHAHVIQSA